MSRLNVMWAAAVVLVLATAPVAASERLQQLLDAHLRAEGVSGGAVLVSGPSGRFLVVSGLAERGRQVAVTPESRFYIASIGKMFVATAVLQLVEEGRIALDDRLDKLLPGYGGLNRLANARVANLRQLLDHSSGIPDYLDQPFEKAAAAAPGRVWTAEEALAFAHGLPATGAPGKSHEYSNSNYLLLGLILERVDAAPLGDVLTRRIGQRAGLTRTTAGANPNDQSLAHGYVRSSPRAALRDVSLQSWRSVLGDGPVVTSAGDLEAFMFALLRDGKLLGPTLVASMVRPSAADEGYGLGVELGEDDWGRYVGHTGRYEGFEAEAWFYRKRGTVIVVLTNGNQTSEESLSEKVAAVIFGAPPAASRRKPAASVAREICLPGKRVEVLWRGEWYPARVQAASRADGGCPIAYDGFPSSANEAVPRERLRLAP